MTKQQEFRKQTEEAKFQAFSLMCEKVAELEKENAKLKSVAEFQQSSNMKRHFEIQELKKENAELKEKVEKAEDLIEDMYDRIPASHSDYYKDVMDRARQFLWGEKNDRKAD